MSQEGGKQYEVAAAAVWFTWRKATCETQLDGNLIAAHVANEGLMLLAMISFGRIMLNININTYTIDFSSVPALKEQEFQSEEKGGDSIALNLIWWFHVSIDILKFRLVWSPVQYPCLTPSSGFFSSERDALLWRKERSSNLSLSFLFYKLFATLTHRTTEGLWRASVAAFPWREKAKHVGVQWESNTQSFLWA